MESEGKQQVYLAINAVQKDVAASGVGKDSVAGAGSRFQYAFRGIDAVMNVMSPIFARHGLIVFPSYKHVLSEERKTSNGGISIRVIVHGTFKFVSSNDGSSHSVETIGEGSDSGDKATNKAMSAALKYALLQTFLVPTEGDNDGDATIVAFSGGDATKPPSACFNHQEKVALTKSRVSELQAAAKRGYSELKELIDATSFESEGATDWKNKNLNHLIIEAKAIGKQ